VQPASYSHTAGYKSLMTYIVYQALLDLKSSDKKQRDNAKKFLLSNDCELFCEAIDFDYQLIRKIDFDNATKYLNFNAKIVQVETIIDDDYVS
jgi:hypothetical protein